MEQTGSDELCERLEQLAQAIESQVEAINGLSSAVAQVVAAVAETNELLVADQLEGDDLEFSLDSPPPGVE